MPREPHTGRMEANDSLEISLREKVNLINLFVLFLTIYLIFYTFQPRGFIWLILVECTILWFLIEFYQNRNDSKALKKALIIGLSLMLIGFIVENLGKVLGLWSISDSVFFIFYIPLEAILICFFAGFAWSLYLPKKSNLNYSLYDVLIFSIFGTLGEIILIKNDILQYHDGWGTPFVFIGYVSVWVLLHVMNYRIVDGIIEK